MGACARAVQTYIAQYFARPSAKDCFDKQLNTLSKLKSAGLEINPKDYKTLIKMKSDKPEDLQNFTIDLTHKNMDLRFVSLVTGKPAVNSSYITFNPNFDLKTAEFEAVNRLQDCFRRVSSAINKVYDFDLFKKPTSCNDDRIALPNAQAFESEVFSSSVKTPQGTDIYQVVNVKSSSGRWFSLGYYIDDKFGAFRYPVLAPNKAKLSW